MAKNGEIPQRIVIRAVHVDHRAAAIPAVGQSGAFPGPLQGVVALIAQVEWRGQLHPEAGRGVGEADKAAISGQRADSLAGARRIIGPARRDYPIVAKVDVGSGRFLAGILRPCSRGA